MHPANHARSAPDKPACIMTGSGAILTYRQLDDRSNQAAQLFRSLGLVAGDVVAAMLSNSLYHFPIAWAAQRSGLYFTSISTKLSSEEVAFILDDSGAKILITEPEFLAQRTLASIAEVPTILTVGPPHAGLANFDLQIAAMPARPVGHETAGTDLLYSSGTTGRPKGIKPALTGGPIDAPVALTDICRKLLGFSADSLYLSPAPLYHAAPLRYAMALQRLGATVLCMERFDAQAALAVIEAHRVTAGQFVPTHFIRMLKLPADIRARHDLSSLRSVVHAGAPCPVHVKEQMMAWWGPILHEYYAGTEANGICYISPRDWLTHKGSVGRAVIGTLKICNDDGDEVPPQTEGEVFFADGPAVSYHNDPVKTASVHNRHGWSSLGDIGRIDGDGFLYLTDRRSFMIISGGVNIYPQEVENALVQHGKVADVAVIGAPDEELGERVVAIVQPSDWADAGPALAEELIAFVRARVSHVKAPRRIDFMAELPREPTGKLHKRLLRARYWPQLGSAHQLVASPVP